MNKNNPKCPLFDTIWQYSTIFDFIKRYFFLCETNRLAYFDPIRVPSNKTNVEYF